MQRAARHAVEYVIFEGIIIDQSLYDCMRIKYCCITVWMQSSGSIANSVHAAALPSNSNVALNEKRPGWWYSLTSIKTNADRPTLSPLMVYELSQGSAVVVPGD
jgi:hypothetical protein